ncbi:hypothetical protein ACFEMC_09725 [Kineococcus sp. DHX-1]|uniref:hypothetical protein n=1 Tax=Kineococcus sp. DHX-1 TaxID=3349638 RepID=UPI0036D3329D
MDARTAARRRRALGVLVAVVGLLVVAVPAFWCLVFAYSSFSGCFLGCGPSDPANGVLWGGSAVLLLGAAVLAGRVVARTPRRRAEPPDGPRP